MNSAGPGENLWSRARKYRWQRAAVHFTSADMALLDAQPLQIDPLKINKIQVMETSKAGNVVDQRVK